MEISLRSISYDETAGAISQEVAVSVECPECVVDIGKFHDSYRKDKRNAIKFALERLGVHPSRARALEEAGNTQSLPQTVCCIFKYDCGGAGEQFNSRHRVTHTAVLTRSATHWYQDALRKASSRKAKRPWDGQF